MDDELWTVNDITAALGWTDIEANQAISRWVVNGLVHHAGTSPSGYSQYQAWEVRAASTKDRLNTVRIARRSI